MHGRSLGIWNVSHSSLQDKALPLSCGDFQDLTILFLPNVCYGGEKVTSKVWRYFEELLWQLLGDVTSKQGAEVVLE